MADASSSLLARCRAALAAFSLESLFLRKRSSGTPRTVYVNQPLPDHFFDHKRRPIKTHVLPTNQVISSKYTIITFLPRNLLEQFRRIANMYVSPGPLSSQVSPSPASSSS